MSGGKKLPITPKKQDDSRDVPRPVEPENRETDNVDEASRESFPASDSPAWTAKHETKKKRF